MQQLILASLSRDIDKESVDERHRCKSGEWYLYDRGNRHFQREWQGHLEL